MIYKIGLCGATGRMGLEVAGLLSGAETFEGDLFELADAVGRPEKYSSVEGVAVRGFEKGPREPVHGWIDFSQPDATMELLETIESPILIATTGFDSAQLQKIRAYAEKYPVLLASNTSPGINIVNALLASVPSASTLKYDVVLFEEHHRHKKDSPSGTAKTLLEALKKRGYDNPQIHVTRAGGIRGTHSIKFISDEESFEIRHEAFNRQVFARGALLGMQYLLKNKKPAGLYSMAEVFAVET